MKTSIIIPCYNQQDFVCDAIESALNQTVQAEVIFVDDGSTDNSLSIAKKYKKLKIVHQVNKGLSSARNTGIMNAKGNYIIPLDADDILKPECVEKIQGIETDIIMWDFKSFGVENKESRLAIPTLESMKVANGIAYCSAIKKSALLEAGGYSPRMIWGYEDYHLWIDLISRGKTISHIKEVLFLYRTKSESMITEARKHHEELMEQITKDHYAKT